MRKIKFRGKRRDDNKWVYGYVCKCDIIPIDKYKESNFGFLEEQECYYCHKDTIGQFTGLKDKNGKEIYEGDIVNFEGIWLIYFDEQVGILLLKNCINKGGLDRVFGYSYVQNSEIIGNIYDNPELIKEGNDKE